jgi:hypothetical protein
MNPVSLPTLTRKPLRLLKLLPQQSRLRVIMIVALDGTRTLSPSVRRVSQL